MVRMSRAVVLSIFIVVVVLLLMMMVMVMTLFCLPSASCIASMYMYE